MDRIMICEYGCGREGKYFFKIVKKWCCEDHCTKCPNVRQKMSSSAKIKFFSDEHRRKIGGFFKG